MTGIPNGLRSFFPGFGIQTRLSGSGFLLAISFGWIASTIASLPVGWTDFTPSMPAVFLPWLSWVTRRTAKSRADRDFISSFWSLWTVFRSPRSEALKIRFCRWYRCCSSLRQGISAHSSLGFLSGALVFSMRLALLHSIVPGLRQHILNVTSGIGFSDHPSRQMHTVGTCSYYMRAICWLLRSDSSFCVAVGFLLSAGFIGGECRSRQGMSAPNPCPFGPSPALAP